MRVCRTRRYAELTCSTSHLQPRLATSSAVGDRFYRMSLLRSHPVR